MRNWPIFAQIVTLAALAILLATLLMFAITFRGPPPMPPPVTIAELGEALAGAPGPRIGTLEILRSSAPLAPRAGERANASLDRMIARRTGLASVRGYYRLDGPPRDDLPELRGEFTVGVETATGWRIARTPERPLLTGWHLSVAAGMTAVLILLMVAAAHVARRISAPIETLAEAADRMTLSREMAAPEQGPAEIRRLARALNDLQQRLRQDVARRTDMLIAIAHDMGTPLTRLAFHAEKLDDASRERAMAEIREAKSMIKAVLAYARGQQPGTEPVSIPALVRQIANAHRATGEVVEVGDLPDVTVRGDPVALARLTANLVENALRYAGSVRIGGEMDHGALRLWFEDQGPGLDDSLLDRMFEPFTRGEASRSRETGGAGLGLAIARQIADAHGGTITGGNRPEGGARFVVTLPLG